MTNNITQQSQILKPDEPLTKKPFSRRSIIIGLAGLAVAEFVKGNGSQLLSSFLQPLIVALKPPIVVRFLCGSEKARWIQAAIMAFNQSGVILNNQRIQVELDVYSSNAQDQILSSNIHPTAWSPASSLELKLLNTKWRQYHPGKDIVSQTSNLAPRPLVFSPLVFAVWGERALALLKKYGSIDWPSIHDALTLNNGWASLGHSEWGLVKFGHTRPDFSSDGLLTIVLIAYAFFKQQRALKVEQVRDPHFLSYLSGFENAVNAFGRSSGTFLTNVVLTEGPAQYDLITTYENLVLTLQNEAMSQGQPLQMFYPSLNVVSDHPFAILQGSWVTPEEQEAALIFRDFLLARQQQKQALTFGFRPTNSNVQITNKLSDNPFLNHPSDITIQPQIQSLAQIPDSQVIDALIMQWLKLYDGTQTASG